MNKREIDRNHWLTRNAPARLRSMQELPGDASFRRYFRIGTDEKNYLLMDSPAAENPYHFVAVANQYRAIAVRTPVIFAEDLAQGFLLLEDFGEQLLIDILNPENASTWYRLCYQELPKIQSCTQINQLPLLDFVSQLLVGELEQFKQWTILQFAGLTLSDEDERCFEKTVQQIQTVCGEQPQVGVHRDYHARNLMVLSDGTIGILDFQDAVVGPVTYDLVSLLRDCYIDWPKEQVDFWLEDYYQSFADSSAYSLAEFRRWFDWQGLQRHLKALFIFCRKYLRDGSLHYLAAIPRTLRYAIDESASYPELAWLHQFLTTRLAKPLLQRAQMLTTLPQENTLPPLS